MPFAETLGLDDDGDDLELVDRIERAFGLRFDREPNGWRTLGDVQATLEARLAGEGGACATSMAFHRLRRVLVAAGATGRIGPRTQLPGLVRLPPRALHTLIESELGLASPGSTLGWLGIAGGVALLIGFLGAVFTLVQPVWSVLLLIPIGAAMIAIDPGRHADATVGELARRLAARNFGRLAALGADRRAPAIWRALRDLAADFAGLDRDTVAAGTRLLA